MAKTLILSGSAFLDTAYAIALASTTDEFHPQALALADEHFQQAGFRALMREGTG